MNKFAQMQSKIILSEAVDNILKGHETLFSCNQLHHLLMKDLTFKEDEEITTENGVALSPSQAADCINDYNRTTQFLMAVNDTIQRRKKEKLSILYVGPGPFGTLLMPLLHRYNFSDFEHIHFVEINDKSASILSDLLCQFDHGWSNIKVFNQNALEYKTNITYDLIICEAMYKGLTVEPQVILTQYLSRFLKLNGIFIPEKITIISAFSNLEKEPVFGKELSSYPKRKSEKAIWTLGIPFVSFDPKWELILDIFEDDELIILTEIQVLGKHQLKSGESLITDPISIPSGFKQSNKYRLKYIQDDSPKWVVELR